MTSPVPRRRSRKVRAVALLVLTTLAYFAGVGLSFAFGTADPWTHGVVGVGPVLGGAIADVLFRRSRER